MNKVLRKSHIWEKEENGFYIEPEWCSTRLFRVERFKNPIWDPACGSGRVVRAARQAGHTAFGSDIVKRWDEARESNFLENDAFSEEMDGNVDIVSNPPFHNIDEFVRKGYEYTKDKACFLLPLAWIAGNTRSTWLEALGLRTVWVLCPRPSMPPGQVVLTGGPVGGGTKDFAWYVFVPGYTGPPILRWLRRDD